MAKIALVLVPMAFVGGMTVPVVHVVNVVAVLHGLVTATRAMFMIVIVVFDVVPNRVAFVPMTVVLAVRVTIVQIVDVVVVLDRDVAAALAVLVLVIVVRLVLVRHSSSSVSSLQRMFLPTRR